MTVEQLQVIVEAAFEKRADKKKKTKSVVPYFPYSIGGALGGGFGAHALLNKLKVRSKPAHVLGTLGSSVAASELGNRLAKAIHG